MSQRSLVPAPRKRATPQAVNARVWAACDILRRSNCAGALQYVPELTWLLFLRILDEREELPAGRTISDRFVRSHQPGAPTAARDIDVRIRRQPTRRPPRARRRTPTVAKLVMSGIAARPVAR